LIRWVPLLKNIKAKEQQTFERYIIKMKPITLLFTTLLALVASVQGFVPIQRSPFTTSLKVEADIDPDDIVARRIIVQGDVQGGYYRSCVKNEVSNLYGYIFITNTGE
jgi:hypothetical protein